MGLKTDLFTQQIMQIYFGGKDILRGVKELLSLFGRLFYSD